MSEEDLRNSWMAAILNFDWSEEKDRKDNNNNEEDKKEKFEVSHA